MLITDTRKSCTFSKLVVCLLQVIRTAWPHDKLVASAAQNLRNVVTTVEYSRPRDISSFVRYLAHAVLYNACR